MYSSGTIFPTFSKNRIDYYYFLTYCLVYKRIPKQVRTEEINLLFRYKLLKEAVFEPKINFNMVI